MIGVVVSAAGLVTTLSASDQQRAVAAQRDRGDLDTHHVETERLDRAACHILAGGQREAPRPLDLHRDVLVPKAWPSANAWETAAGLVPQRRSARQARARAYAAR